MAQISFILVYFLTVLSTSIRTYVCWYLLFNLYYSFKRETVEGRLNGSVGWAPDS